MDGGHYRPQAGNDPLRLGMPHLGPAGLSEQWLLKELGHRHWLLLAETAGRMVPDFRSSSGAPVYAAFSALALSGLSLDRLGENDLLAIDSVIERLSRSQIASRHHLRAADGSDRGRVTLISTFISRVGQGGNHDIARVTLDHLPPIALDSPAQTLAAHAAGARAARRAAAAPNGPLLRFDPCPSLDFNGAGLLYFASFIALVERSEWQLARPLASTGRLGGRQAFFYGNADPGETIEVSLMLRPGGHDCRLYRSSDHQLIAEILTEKQ